MSEEVDTSAGPDSDSSYAVVSAASSWQGALSRQSGMKMHALPACSTAPIAPHFRIGRAFSGLTAAVLFTALLLNTVRIGPAVLGLPDHGAVKAVQGWQNQTEVAVVELQARAAAMQEQLAEQERSEVNALEAERGLREFAEGRIEQCRIYGPGFC